MKGRERACPHLLDSRLLPNGTRRALLLNDSSYISMSDHGNGRLSASQFQSTMEAAQVGSRKSLGALLESCRQYFLLIVNQEMPVVLAAKVGASDLVQDTRAAEQTKIHQFRGSTKAEWRAWMR